MAVDIDIGNAVTPQPTVCTQLRVSMPGGMVIQGTTPGLGSSPLEVARATIASANGALAPLGPFFSMLDVLMSVIDFAKSVPKVVMNPGAVAQAVVDLLKKAAKLANLIPQLSIPLMILGIIDVLIAFLVGLQTEVESLTNLQTRLDAVITQSATVPALVPIATSVTAQIAARQSQISCAMGDVQPLLTVMSILMKLIGLPPIELSGDTGGSLSELNDLLETLIDVLTSIRATIPI